MKTYFLILAILLFSFSFSYGKKSSCVTCHTDEAILKKLVKVPELGNAEGEGWAGAPPSVKADEYYKAFLVDKNLIGKDVHLSINCTECHKGDDKKDKKEEAHLNLNKRPSDNIDLCARCHKDIARNYKVSLHYMPYGLKNVFAERLSAKEKKIFEEKVFEKSCRSCHASCGDCHVKSPVVGGVNLGLIKGHKFIKRDESKTCALCHGGRVYPEYTGEYNGISDVHYQKGMMCMDCHSIKEIHGDGTPQLARKLLEYKNTCTKCHKPGSEKTDKAKEAHRIHDEGKVSCFACHVGGEYRNCYNCHVGEGSTSKPGFILGRNPRAKNQLTTLRIVPTVRDTFKKVGIKMENFDKLPNYWDSAVHNIKKRTDRTRNCDTCHTEKKNFLKKEDLIPNGSRANEELIFEFKK